MFHQVDTVFNATTSKAIPGVEVRVYDGGGALVDIYADEGGTPIATVSGVANTAVTDDDGLYDFWVEDGVYDIQFSFGSSLLRTLQKISLDGSASAAVATKANATALGVAASAGNLGAFSGTTIPENQTAKQAIQALETAHERLLSVASGEGDSLVMHLPEGADAVARSVFSINRETKRLTDRLTTSEIDDILSGTAAVDVTAKFNSALADAEGKRLVLPWGVIRVNADGSHLAVTADGTWIEGQGTRIVSAHATSDIIRTGDAVDQISGLVFANLTFWSSVVKTAGECINARMTSDSLFENVRLGSIDDYVANGHAHRLWNGVYFDRFSQIRWEGGEWVVGNYGGRHRGNIDQSFGAEITYDGGLNIKHTGNYAFLFGGGAGGVYLNQVSVGDCFGGCRWDKTLTNIYNREAFLGDVSVLDTLASHAVYISADGLETLDLHGWISACGPANEGAVHILGTTSVNATGLRMQSSQYDAAHIDGGAWTQAGGLIRNNGLGANGGHGINFVSGRLTIDGVIIHDNGDGARGIGVNIDPSADNYSVTNNDFFSNGQRAVTASAAVGATKIIRDNRGHVTESVGTAQMANGTSSITINHGLSDTPTYVSFGWAGAPDSAALYAAPGDFTTTQMVIRANANVSATRDIWWRAVRM